jgi:hypothetical protein
VNVSLWQAYIEAGSCLGAEVFVRPAGPDTWRQGML